MIQAYLREPQVLSSNTDNINFDFVDVRSRSADCCGWLQYIPGTSDFTILGGGTFEISFNCNVSSPVGQGALAIKTATGTDLEGTEMDFNTTTEGVYNNVSCTKLVRICPRINTTIAVGSIPALGGLTPTTETEIPTVKDANLIIRKIA